MPTPALTLKNLKGPIAKASGKPAAKTTAALWTQIDGLAPAEDASTKFARDPTRPDGFNGFWYAHVRPDVIANGMDPFVHYATYGKFLEGMTPYEGGPTWKPEDYTGLDWLAAFPPQVQFLPDLYFPLDAEEVFCQFRLSRMTGDRDPYRTWDARISFERGGDNQPLQERPWYYYDPTSCVQLDDIFAEHNGWTMEATVKLHRRGHPGTITGYLHDAKSDPWIVPFGEARQNIHIGIEPPKGYVHPKRITRKPAALPAQVKRWDYETDFKRDIDDWRLANGGFLLNRSQAVHSDGSDIRGGNVIRQRDDGVQLCVQDYGADEAGWFEFGKPATRYRFAAAAIERQLGDGRSGYMEIDLIAPHISGIDLGVWYWKDALEMDHGETWGTPEGRLHDITFHDHRRGIKAGYHVAGDASRRRTLKILRDVKNDRYAQWVRYHEETEDRLVCDGPNYLGDQDFKLMLSCETFSTVAGDRDTSIEYDGLGMTLYGLRYQQV